MGGDSRFHRTVSMEGGRKVTCRCTASGEAGGAALLVGDFMAAAGDWAKADMHDACGCAE